VQVQHQLTGITNTVRKFYSQFNNIMSELGKGSHEMNVVQLLKTLLAVIKELSK